MFVCVAGLLHKIEDVFANVPGTDVAPQEIINQAVETGTRVCCALQSRFATKHNLRIQAHNVLADVGKRQPTKRSRKGMSGETCKTEGLLFYPPNVLFSGSGSEYLARLRHRDLSPDHVHVFCSGFNKPPTQINFSSWQ